MAANKVKAAGSTFFVRICSRKAVLDRQWKAVSFRFFFALFSNTITSVVLSHACVGVCMHACILVCERRVCVLTTGNKEENGR